ncbi:MAG: acyl-ACP--UDP-N-acetylglucosamine O-acyltransferase [Verrucomicrobiota bacterium]|jgi:UDP-N-acetylglucosamine acyltransferase|nr:acyl-ACP--UDP-N-acetylglucosamine O-acyltransferase [Verrucomicrobiota bacterium]
MATIHPTAIIDPKAQLDSTVSVGPYAVIGPDVKIGAGTEVQSHAYISGHTTIGQRCEIFPFACVGMKTQDLKYKAGDVTYVEVGDETVLREYSTVHLGTKPGEVTRVGNQCLIMAYCHIAHGCRVGNGVIMSNVATLAGEVTIEDFAVLGGMAGIHQFCRVGAYAMIGGASKVRQDCPPYMVVDASGPDVRVVGPNAVGLQRHGFSADMRSTIKEAYKLLYREGLNRSQALERIKYEVPDTPEIQYLIAFYQNSTRGVH